MKPLTLSRTILAAALCAAPLTASSQAREPLCATVQSRRLLSGPAWGSTAFDRLVARPFHRAGAQGQRFLVLAPDNGGSLREQPGVGTFGWSAPQNAGSGGLLMLRLDAEQRTVDGPTRIALPPAAGDGRAMLTGVSLEAGVLVLARSEHGLVSMLVPSQGAAPSPQRVLTRTADAPALAWVTATARGDGAVALAGDAQGNVWALRFDARGALVGEPAAWTEQQRVGGPLELLPTGRGGPPAALLGRPVQGAGPGGEQARVQALVLLDAQLRPEGTPTATGFAQFPLAYVARNNELVVLQWAATQGLAVGTFAMNERRIATAAPRLFYAQPPLQGTLVGHDAWIDREGITYDLVTYQEGAGLAGHLAWITPAGQPIVRRAVLPTRGLARTPPQLLPAEDGVLVVQGLLDETGGAVDLFHVRCELVSVTAQ